jgi:hypothetical protein
MYAELTQFSGYGGTDHVLKFTSVYTDAKDPTAEQVKAQFILDRHSIRTLVSLLNIHDN